MTRDPVLTILTSYPQIYHACHLRHATRSTSPSALSVRDAQILSHLSDADPVGPAELAAHLGLSESTVSEAIKRLTTLGLVDRQVLEHDRRRVALRRTDAGSDAIREVSVLDASRVEQLLQYLTPADRDRAVDGIALLANAALALNHAAPQHWAGAED
jgi:DNA-binding MarR family transcriptional regulator